jgi:hypothetical protein
VTLRKVGGIYFASVSKLRFSFCIARAGNWGAPASAAMLICLAVPGFAVGSVAGIALGYTIRALLPYTERVSAALSSLSAHDWQSLALSVAALSFCAALSLAVRRYDQRQTAATHARLDASARIATAIHRQRAAEQRAAWERDFDAACARLNRMTAERNSADSETQR